MSIFVARFLSWAWELLMKVILAPLYLTAIADGLRRIAPFLGQKLHRLSVPFASYLQDYEATYRLDLAIILSLVIMIGVFYFWQKLLWVHLRADREYTDGRWNPQLEVIFYSVVGGALLLADILMFYYAITNAGWAATFSVSAVLATVAYCSVLVFISFVSLNLKMALYEAYANT